MWPTPYLHYSPFVYNVWYDTKLQKGCNGCTSCGVDAVLFVPPENNGNAAKSNSEKNNMSLQEENLSVFGRRPDLNIIAICKRLLNRLNTQNRAT